MRSPLRVTIQPIDMPSRSLNAAIDLVALVMTGFWPAICASSLTAPSISLAFCVASPSPMLMEILSILGTAMTFLYPNSWVSAGTAVFKYFSLKRAAMNSSLGANHLAALAADSRAARLSSGDMVDVVGDAHGLVAARTHHQDVGSRNGALALGDAALDLFAGIGARVPLDHHHVLHQYLARLAVHAQNAAGLAFIAPGDHLDGVFPLDIDADRIGRARQSGGAAT